ncbi:MAG TPA: UDP-N-acetylmuramate dehydrogenase [Candidatus Binatia bacterium]|jgi:UDP-N-acetylmuramate dehydrogenase|nr:UDP-N-acetylmuramate dehydrogenase [Candidatus Binatia bacterium]
MINELRARISPDVKEGEPLAKHTTFKIGGPAECFFEAKTADDAVRAVNAAKALGIPCFVFGGGSNMLVSDDGVKGLVVKMANRDFKVGSDGEVTAEAGAPTGLVSTRVTEAGFTGFEWAVGVPGTIGGAVRGNAGAYGGETKDALISVRAFKDGVEEVMANPVCGFAYRDSAFKKNPGWIVLSATFRFGKAADPVFAKSRLKQILLDRKAKQPVEYPTAGCMFMNWTPSGPEDIESIRRSLDLNKDESIPLTPQGTVPAGWIVDRAQLKGMKVGHVQVSDKHGNFFISDGKAKADDVIALTAALKTRVRNLTGGVIQLREEVEYVGF